MDIKQNANPRVLLFFSLSHDRLFCNPTDCSPPGSSVHGIFQSGILEWVAISFSRGCSQPRDLTHISSTAGGFFPTEPPGKPHVGYESINDSFILYLFFLTVLEFTSILLLQLKNKKLFLKVTWDLASTYLCFFF